MTRRRVLYGLGVLLTAYGLAVAALYLAGLQ